MRRTILSAIIVVGLGTAAQAQTATSAGSDPLSVPTSTLPSNSSFSAGTPVGATGGAVTTSTTATGSTSAISAAASRSSQTPLELSGEGLGSSTQSARTTASAPSAPSTICPPSIPTTDGGSANITEIDGFSPGGC